MWRALVMTRRQTLGTTLESLRLSWRMRHHRSMQRLAEVAECCGKAACTCALFLCFPLCAATYVHVWTSPALQLLKTNKHMKHPHLRGSLEYIKVGMGISCVLAWQC